MSCSDIESTLNFYTHELEFQIDVIFPADAPRKVLLTGYGITVSLSSSVNKPQPESSDWGTGRAGMQYRDLIPDRLNGQLIASHIRIPTGGPVPDYVHHHDVTFQMIYCYKGWVKVVYEDQGPAFIMTAGDCVLQPPHIRHRVLECSDQMEVIEISSPAEHETHVDREMQLPTSSIDLDRTFGGQRFVKHEASKASWTSKKYEGFESSDTGIASATGGLAVVDVLRPKTLVNSLSLDCDNGVMLLFVLRGSIKVRLGSEAPQQISACESFYLTAGESISSSDFSSGLEILRVAIEMMEASDGR